MSKAVSKWTSVKVDDYITTVIEGDKECENSEKSEENIKTDHLTLQQIDEFVLNSLAADKSFFNSVFSLPAGAPSRPDSPPPNCA